MQVMKRFAVLLLLTGSLTCLMGADGFCFGFGNEDGFFVGDEDDGVFFGDDGIDILD